jgi:DNA-binding XRE family transcriptional regulator
MDAQRARGEPRGASFFGPGEDSRCGGPSPALAGRGHRQRIDHGGGASAVGATDLGREGWPMKRPTQSMERAAMLRLLVQLRETAGVNQTTLAARLGITQSEVSKFERGERALDLLRVRAWLLA